MTKQERLKLIRKYIDVYALHALLRAEAYHEGAEPPWNGTPHQESLDQLGRYENVMGWITANLDEAGLDLLRWALVSLEVIQSACTLDDLSIPKPPWHEEEGPELVGAQAALSSFFRMLPMKEAR